MREHGQKTDKLRIKEKREVFGVPRLTPNQLISFLAEKGGGRTLREPYDSQTGFEDQRHHRAPSFSISQINYLADVAFSSVTISVAISNDVPKALAMSSCRNLT